MFEDIFQKGLRITKAVVIPNSHKIRVVFSNDESGVIDFIPIIGSKKAMEPLKDPVFFSKCAILYDGTTLGWPGDYTMGWDSLYIYAKEQGTLRSGNTITADEFRVWLDKSGIKQKELAAKLGYTPTQISKYAAGKAEIPPVVYLSCLAIQAGLDR